MAVGSAWRSLGLFWLALLVVAAAGLATLAVLGPPRPEEVAVEHGPARSEAPAAAAVPDERKPAPHAEPASAAPVQAAPAAIVPGVARPDPALLERSRAFPQLMLPRVAADGRTARTVYAAPVAVPVPEQAGKPRIALLLAGFGPSERESRTAIETMPGPVGFAVSAYAGFAGPLIESARAAGHELLASIPMEPQGYPLNDEGTRSLRTGLSPEENRANLEWSLGQTAGAVGATGASDGMRGERFADLAGAFDPVVEEITRRGLIYIDPRPGRSPPQPGGATRSVDLVLDEPPARAEIEAKLVSLERIAREKGSAIGLSVQLRPVTLERIAAWAKGLQARGIILVPVSSLVESRK